MCEQLDRYLYCSGIMCSSSICYLLSIETEDRKRKTLQASTSTADSIFHLLIQKEHDMTVVPEISYYY